MEGLLGSLMTCYVWTRVGVIMMFTCELGFSNSALLTFRPDHSWGGVCSVYHRMFGNIPDLHPLDDNNSSSPPPHDNPKVFPRYCWMFPKNKITPGWECPLQYLQRQYICFVWVPGSDSVCVCTLFHNKNTFMDSWVAQLLERLPLAQVGS